MIRGVCGHVWEGPGQSAIVLQLNLDKHEEIFSFPGASSSSLTAKKLKQLPDRNTPIVVRVSVSAPSFEEMPQSLQLWQSRGTDERSMAERFPLLPRIEVFNNTFCVVTVLYREFGFLIVGMTGNLKKPSPHAPCKHNVIVCVEPAISDGKGKEPSLHPLTNLEGPPLPQAAPPAAPTPFRSNSTASSSVPPPLHHQQQQMPHIAAASIPSPSTRPFDRVEANKNSESAFVSPPRQLEPSYPPAAVEVVKKGTNFYHVTRPTAASIAAATLNNNHNNATSGGGFYVPMPSATEMMIRSSNEVAAAPLINEINNSVDAVAVTQQQQKPGDIPVVATPKEDTTALHHRRSDHAAAQLQYGFVSPAVPEDLKFRQPVNGQLVPVASPKPQLANSAQRNNYLRNSNNDYHHPSSGPRSASGILLSKEIQTQTLEIEPFDSRHGITSSPPPPPPPPPESPDASSATAVIRSTENTSPFTQALSVPELFVVLCSRMKDWSESLEDLALMFTAKQNRLFQSSFEAVVGGSQQLLQHQTGPIVVRIESSRKTNGNVVV